MHEHERHNAILNAITARPVVQLRELVLLTGASSATLRRDVVKLEEDGLVRRVHGGVALPVGVVQPHLGAPSFASQRVKNMDCKRAIATAAVALCTDGQSIIINAGTTTFAMVDALRARKLNIVTNSFPIAEALMRSSENRITVPGGEIYREQGIILSPFDDDAIQYVHATMMFMSCLAITPLGVVEADPLIARAEAKLLSRAEKLVIVADSSKFEPRGSLVVCPLSRVSTVVTDDGVSEQSLAMLKQAGVDVIIVPFRKQIASAA